MEECKEMSFTIPKWIFTLGIEVLWGVLNVWDKSANNKPFPS
jgi:hypothetical protein